MTSFAERVANLPPLGVGLGYRGPLRGSFQDPSAPIDCVEVVADHFFLPQATSPKRPADLLERPILVHGLDLSLGTPGPIPSDYLERYLAVARGLDAALISDHLAITRTSEVELGHLNPVPPTCRTRDEVAAKIRAIQEQADLLFLLENVTTHLRLPGELSFPELLNGICEVAETGFFDLDQTRLRVIRDRFGEAIAGDAEFIERAKLVRKRLGGWMRQAGVIAAGGLFALEHNVERLAEDHALARAAAEVLNRRPGIECPPDEVQTNVVMARLSGSERDAVALARALEEQGVRVVPWAPETLRVVTHMDVGPADVERLEAALAAVA